MSHLAGVTCCVTLWHCHMPLGKETWYFPIVAASIGNIWIFEPRHPPTTAFLPTYIHLDSVCPLGQSMVGLWSQILLLVRIIDIPTSRIASKAVRIVILEVAILWYRNNRWELDGKTSTKSLHFYWMKRDIQLIRWWMAPMMVCEKIPAFCLFFNILTGASCIPNSPVSIRDKT